MIQRILGIAMGTSSWGLWPVAAGALVAVVIAWQIDKTVYGSKQFASGQLKQQERTNAANRKAAEISDRARAAVRDPGVRGVVDPNYRW